MYKGIDRKQLLLNLAKSAGILVLCTLLALAMRELSIRVENILMIYLVGVIIIIIEVRGYLWGILCSLICVFTFNYLFTAPYYSFRVSDRNYILTMAIFMVVALITGMLVSKLQVQAGMAKRNWDRMEALFEISSGYLTLSGLDNITYYGIKSLYRVNKDQCIVYLAKDGISLSAPYTIASDYEDPSIIENDTLAKWCFVNITPCGCGTSFYSNSKWRYLPIRSAGRAMGVIGIYCGDRDISDDQMIFIDTVLSQMALAVERELIYREQTAPPQK